MVDLEEILSKTFEFTHEILRLTKEKVKTYV